MIFFNIVFEVTNSSANQCYAIGDEIISDGTMLVPPPGKGLCTLLIPRLLNIIEKEELQNLSSEEKGLSFSCKGDQKECHGVLQLKVQESLHGDRAARKNMGKVLKLISKIDFFQNFSPLELRSLFPLLSYKKSAPGKVIIKKGDHPKNVYIILSGSAEVFDGANKIATLGPGEIVGERGLLGGKEADTTVIVAKTAWIIKIYGANFLKMLTKFPKAQMFLIELISRQLVKEARDRDNEVDTVMSGQLTHLPPAELLQMLNTSQKTGSLILELSKGEAQVQFDNGELLEVQYDRLVDEEAFFEILKESSGRFRLLPRDERVSSKKEIIGSFMGLLLEGLQRIDEQTN